MQHFDQRYIPVQVFGNNTSEMEAKALERAREVFGPDVRLGVDRTYSLVEKVAMTLIKWPADVTLMAYITIKVVDEPNPAYPEQISYLERVWRRWLA